MAGLKWTKVCDAEKELSALAKSNPEIFKQKPSTVQKMKAVFGAYSPNVFGNKFRNLRDELGHNG